MSITSDNIGHLKPLFKEYVQTLIAQGKTRAEAWQIAKQSIQ